MSRLLTSDEIEILVNALTIRENIIETGSHTMSAHQAAKTGNNKKIQPLTTEQMKLIIKSKELKQKILGGELKIYTEGHKK